MSIPERLSRIMRHKISEIKDRFDQLDEDALADPAEIERLRRAQARLEAKQELNESLMAPPPQPPPAAKKDRYEAPTSRPGPDIGGISSAIQPLRSPGQISGANKNGSAANLNSTPPPSNHGSEPQYTSENANDLDFHYRMMGVEVGSDFTVVQAAYNGLSARADPSRFPAGSTEALEVKDIRDRLDASYQILRDALDSTAHRFGLLEFDANPPRTENR